MVSEDELNRAVQKATVAESLAEEKMIASEKAREAAIIIADKMAEKYEKAVQEATDKISRKAAKKIGREMKRAENAKVAAEVEATRVIAEDIRKANATKRAADHALKDYKENRS